jgi:hypothetical protein
VSVPADAAHLRKALERSFGRAESRLARRYGRLPLEPLTAFRRFRKAAGRLRRRLFRQPVPVPPPWHPGLKHVESGDEAMPLVIWALGVDRETLRAACRGFQTLHASLPAFAPVLVTDVADFAYFSRLHWLVEYVPSLAPPAASYAERKRRYLAWLYRDAPVLPASAGLSQQAIRAARSDLMRFSAASG